MNTDKKFRSKRLLLLAVSIIVAGSLLSIHFFMVSSYAKAYNPGAVHPKENPRQSNLANTQVITIGFAGPVSGSLADLGWPIANSAQLAISQTNSAGGLNLGGDIYQVALVMADDECDASQSPAAANTLLTAGAVAVVGHVCSGASVAAEPIYNAAGVAMVSPSSTRPDVTMQGYTTTFRTVTSEGEAPTQMALYFRKIMHFSKSAIVETPNSLWGSLIGDNYQNTFIDQGGMITSRRVVSNTTQFTTTLTSIMGENPDVIFINDPDPVFVGEFRRTAFSLGMTDIAVGWYTASAEQFQLDNFVNSAGAASIGVYAVYSNRPTRDMPGWSSFLSDYQAAGFSHSPDDPGLWGPYAYDAARIILAAIARAGSTDPLTIRDQISATKNFDGIVGTYKGFDSKGDVVPPWVWFAQYRNSQWNEMGFTNVFLPLMTRLIGQ